MQSNFRTRADSQVIGQVHPEDGSCGANQKLGRKRDVVAILTRFGMQDAVAANHLGGWIRQERISVAPGMAKLAVLFRGIDTDRGDFNSALVELVEMLFETP